MMNPTAKLALSFWFLIHSQCLLVHCLDCYVCDSKTHFECTEKFPADTNLKPVSCGNLTKASFCIKTTNLYAGEVGTKRFCSANDNGNYCKYVKQPTGDREYRSCVYTCEGDGCNSSSLPTPLSLIAILTMAIAIIFFSRLSDDNTKPTAATVNDDHDDKRELGQQERLVSLLDDGKESGELIGVTGKTAEQQQQLQQEAGNLVNILDVHDEDYLDHSMANDTTFASALDSDLGSDNNGYSALNQSKDENDSSLNLSGSLNTRLPASLVNNRDSQDDDGQNLNSNSKLNDTTSSKQLINLLESSEHSTLGHNTSDISDLTGVSQLEESVLEEPVIIATGVIQRSDDDVDEDDYYSENMHPASMSRESQYLPRSGTGDLENSTTQRFAENLAKELIEEGRNSITAETVHAAAQHREPFKEIVSETQIPRNSSQSFATRSSSIHDDSNKTSSAGGSEQKGSQDITVESSFEQPSEKRESIESVRVNQQQYSATTQTSVSSFGQPGQRRQSRQLNQLMTTTKTQVTNILTWKDPILSGLAFALGLSILISLTFSSIISVISYHLMTLIIASAGFRVYSFTMETMNQPNPLDAAFDYYLGMDLTVSPELAHEVLDSGLNIFNHYITKFKDILMVEDKINSLKFVGVLFAFTYIGAWFNGFTLVVLAYLAAFSIPKGYSLFKPQIDQAITMVEQRIPRGLLN
ncbi:Reticulon-4 [Fragariocoptes setiger]|uniref:Reticulon-like protein n=1 Tax=Fragariocoptes setiger TaxID=1670756 RepID=A0ABQ7S6Q7_9ACAR|nr:Reticulon-4 [Fragariocoptes setiger]